MPELRLPSEVLDVGPTRGREAQRVDRERVLGEDDPALGQAEGVHVGGLPDRLRGDHLGLRAVLGPQQEEAVMVSRAQLRRVVEHPAARAVEMGMGGGQLPRHVPGDPGGLERRRVELNGQRRLGHRDEALPELNEVDVAVVGELRHEHREGALKERAAGVGRELREGDLVAVARRGERLALEEAVRVGDPAVRDAEAVEHRQPVEPVPHLAPARLELRRTGADERPGEPDGDLALDRQGVDAGLGVESLEPAPQTCRSRGRGRRRRACDLHLGLQWFGSYRSIRMYAESARLAECEYLRFREAVTSGDTP